MKDLRQFILALREAKEIVDIDVEVDPYLEIAEIHRQVIEKRGPALFFHRVKGSSFPVVTNLFGSEARIKIAFGKEPEKAISDLLSFFEGNFSLKKIIARLASLISLPTLSCPLRKELKADLFQLPLLTSWPKDAGPFLTLPLVLTQDIETKSYNLGIYRMQRFTAKTAGLHFQTAKGSGFHYKKAESKNVSLPVSVFLGGPPILTLAAIAPLPENLSEIFVASFLQNRKIKTRSHGSYTLFPACEFALLGHSPAHERRLEGPFGDHYGNYGQKENYPVFHLKKLLARKDAIYPATVVGKPFQEDYFLGNYLQKLFLPLVKLTMPAISDLFCYGESGFHTALGATIKKRYLHEVMTGAFRILGEGQLALTKTLFFTDCSLDLSDFKKLLTHILERTSTESDLFIISPAARDSLDYSNSSGSKLIWLGSGEKKRDLPSHFDGPLPSFLERACAYAPGALLLQSTSKPDFDTLLHLPIFKKWPLLILVDDISSAKENFLWTCFTHFDPATDLYAKKISLHRHRLSYEMPILIDARKKPHHPPEVESDPTLSKKVKEKFALFS